MHHFLKQLPHFAISIPGPSLDVGRVISKTKKTYTPCHDKGQRSHSKGVFPLTIIMILSNPFLDAYNLLIFYWRASLGIMRAFAAV